MSRDDWRRIGHNQARKQCSDPKKSKCEESFFAPSLLRILTRLLIVLSVLIVSLSITSIVSPIIFAGFPSMLLSLGIALPLFNNLLIGISLATFVLFNVILGFALFVKNKIHFNEKTNLEKTKGELTSSQDNDKCLPLFVDFATFPNPSSLQRPIVLRQSPSAEKEYRFSGNTKSWGVRPSGAFFTKRQGIILDRRPPLNARGVEQILRASKGAENDRAAIVPIASV